MRYLTTQHGGRRDRSRWKQLQRTLMLYCQQPQRQVPAPPPSSPGLTTLPASFSLEDRFFHCLTYLPAPYADLYAKRKMSSSRSVVGSRSCPLCPRLSCVFWTWRSPKLRAFRQGVCRGYATWLASDRCAPASMPSVTAKGTRLLYLLQLHVGLQGCGGGGGGGWLVLACPATDLVTFLWADALTLFHSRPAGRWFCASGNRCGAV